MAMHAVSLWQTFSTSRFDQNPLEFTNCNRRWLAVTLWVSERMFFGARQFGYIHTHRVESVTDSKVPIG